MSHPSDDPRPSAPAAGQPTLEMLFRIKRAERPEAAFWADFERGLRQKQLAASIEPRPWWLGLSLLSRRLAPLGLPVSAGAAALLAVVVVRTQSPFGAQPGQVEFGPFVAAVADASSPEAPRPVALESSPASSEPAGLAAQTPLNPKSAPALASADVADLRDSSTMRARAEAAPVALAEASLSAPALPVVATLLELPAESAAPSPSQLTIAQNLAALRAEASGLMSAWITTADRSSASAEIAAVVGDEEADRSINPRHARLLAMAETSGPHSGDLAGVRERMVHRLAHDETVYGSSSRLAAAGDRFSLSF